MRRWRRDYQMARVSPQQSKVYFSFETQRNQECAICLRFSSAVLVKPCQCNFSYHEQCLLLFIRRRILQELKERQEMDLTTLRCSSCNNRYFLMFRHQIICNCQNFCEKMSEDCCNSYIKGLSIILVIMIITVTLSIFFEIDKESQSSLSLKYGLISALVIQGLVFLAVLATFLNKYMTTKQFILQKVLDMIDVRSVSSENSEENKVNDDQEVIIIT